MPKKAQTARPLSLLFMIGFIVIYYVWIWAWSDNEIVRTLGGNLLSVTGTIIACYWLYIAWMSSKRRHRPFWLLLLLGCISYTVAELIWLTYENVMNVKVPFPSYADIFYVIQVLFYMLAFFYKLQREKGSLSVIRLLLDIAILMTVLTTLSWHFLIRFIIALTGMSYISPEVLLSITYAISDLVLLGGASSLYLSKIRTLSSKVVLFLCAGLLLQVVGDTLFLYSITLNNDNSGSWLDPLFTAGLLLAGYAGIVHIDELKQPCDPNVSRVLKPEQPRLDIPHLVIPYLGITALFLFMILNADGRYMLTIGTGLAIVLVMIRQVMVIIENHRLARTLYDKKLELENSENRYRSIVDFHPDAIMAIGLDGRIESANPQAELMHGVSEQEMIGKYAIHYFCDAQTNNVLKRIEMVLQGHPQIYETTLSNCRGDSFPVRMTNVPIIVQGKVVGMYGIAKDITENKRHEEQVHYLAYHDALTGLMNRAAFESELSETVQVARVNEELFSILFIDLDRFKNINDTLGHDVGDQLLRSVAQRLQSCVRDNDMVARLGGDEFTLLIRHMKDTREASVVAQRILDSMNAPHFIQGYEIIATPSIGIALYDGEDESPITLMKKADIAMYQVKKNGKGHYRFYNDNDLIYSKKLMLEKELSQALYRNELMLHYQPQIDATRGSVVGVEALIRWEHGTLGMIMPGEFIPIAEETGLMLPIGEWVLREACEQAKRWQNEGHLIKIGINLSARQFEQENFVTTVARILKQTGVNPAYIDLEITETIAMTSINNVIVKLNALKQLGVSISIDDFGTGYSSLAYLENFPVDKLKIAREFTSRIGSSRANHMIISSIVNLARSLNMNVIAEGVENHEQASALKKIRCHEMQGYLFSKPISAEELSKLLIKAPFKVDFKQKPTL
ncbi:DUF4084 domain-containing protein [Paenibacillus sp. SGZ-1009]|uniref:DUF4084 domain-containing protein n=1 Tax=Paenibacillus campi TaxID=3106031 RepID=UPI002AFF05F9|nr:DUF4084 domain-containing protein [Paenibacillus sp. SGZ-1009]